MTTPSNPQDPFNKPDGDNSSDGHVYGGLPHYNSTSYPEDQPGFGAQGQPGYGSPESPYGGYGSGQSGNEQPLYGGNAANIVAGDGKIHVFDAISWAFSSTFKNWKLWILGSLVITGCSALVSFLYSITQSSVVSGAFGFAFFFISPVIARLVLRQVDGPQPGWSNIGEDVNYFPAMCVYLVYGVVIQIVLLVLGFSAFALSGGYNAVAGVDSLEYITNEQLFSIFTSVLVAGAVVLIVAILVAPLFLCLWWLPVDRRAGFAGSFVQSLKLGIGHYSSLLGFIVILVVISVVLIIVTIGIASIVVAPVAYLAWGYVYRQMVGSPVSR